MVLNCRTILTVRCRKRKWRTRRRWRSSVDVAIIGHLTAGDLFPPASASVAEPDLCKLYSTEIPILIESQEYILNSQNLIALMNDCIL